VRRRILASEYAGPDELGRALCAHFGWPAPLAEPLPEEKPEPQPFKTFRSRFGKFFIRSGSEIWDAVQMGNGRFVPSWVTGGKLDDGPPPPRPPSKGFYSLLPDGNEVHYGRPKRKPLWATYSNKKLNDVLDDLGRRKGIW